MDSESIVSELEKLNLELAKALVAYKEAGSNDAIFEVKKSLLISIRLLEKRIAEVRVFLDANT